MTRPAGVAKVFALAGTATWDDPKLTLSWHATAGASSAYYTFVGGLSADGSKLAGDNADQISKKVEALTFTRK